MRKHIIHHSDNFHAQHNMQSLPSQLRSRIAGAAQMMPAQPAAAAPRPLHPDFVSCLQQLVNITEEPTEFSPRPTQHWGLAEDVAAAAAFRACMTKLAPTRRYFIIR